MCSPLTLSTRLDIGKEKEIRKHDMEIVQKRRGREEKRAVEQTYLSTLHILLNPAIVYKKETL